MSFADQINAFVVEAKGLTDEVVAEAVTGVAFKIDQRSPVDTGHFRANWQLGVNVRPTAELAGFDRDGSGLSGRVTARIPVEAAGKVYWLANNVPYAMRLEMGHSKQAPQGMVGITAVEWQQIVSKAAAKVRR